MRYNAIRSAVVLALCFWRYYLRNKRRKKSAVFDEELPPDHICIKDDRAGAPKEEVTETEQQNRQTQSPPTTAQPFSEPLDRPAEVPQAGKSSEASQKDQEGDHNINWLAWQTSTQAVGTLFMIGVLSYHAFLFSGQQQAMKDQSKFLAQSVAQTKVLISQQQDIEQARIGVRRIELTKLAVGQLPTVTVTFFNGGRTSATQFKFARVIYFTREGDLFTTIQRLIRKPVNSFGGSFMPPGGEMKVVFTGNFPVRQDQLTAMPYGEVSLFFEVYVNYVDGFGRDQKWKFCAWYNADPMYKEFEEYECKEDPYHP